MKKILLFAAIAATVGFTSCTKENETVNLAGDNLLVVKLPENVATRVAEAPVLGASVTATINDVTVFMLNGDVVAATYDFEPVELTAKEAHIENVSPSVNGVLVLANIPSADAAAVKAITSAAAIKKYAFSTASQNGSGKLLTQTLMGSTSQFENKPDPTHPGREYKECTVNIEALTARFEIAGVTAGTGIKSVEIVGVWINSFYKTGARDDVQKFESNAPEWVVTLDGGQTLGSPSINEFTNHTLAAYTGYSEYHDAGNAAVTAGASPSMVYAYQVFAGDNIPHLVLLVKGEYLTEQTEGLNDKYFMGYLTFTKFYDQGSEITSVVNNTIYKIGHSADGIVIDGGTITPKPELKNYDLGIKVTLEGWTDKNVVPGM